MLDLGCPRLQRYLGADRHGAQQTASGYTGGAAGTPHYDTVEQGDTGHAESVLVNYDLTRTTYGRLLQVFFSVAHDPNGSECGWDLAASGCSLYCCRFENCEFPVAALMSSA